MNMLYNGLENTIVRWSCKSYINDIENDQDINMLCDDIELFVKDTFLKNLSLEYRNNASNNIKQLILDWHFDGTQTAGALTRSIVKIMEAFELAYIREKLIDDILE